MPDGLADAAERDADSPTLESPWGIASSASSSRVLGSWAPAISATGIDWLRGFDSGSAAARLKDAANSQLHVSGILFYSSASNSAATFPVDDIPGWTNYVTGLVTQCKGQVSNWEIWNEPPNFTENKAPSAYAAIVRPAYDAVKAVDGSIQVGLAAQSNHVNWLEQTILSGAKDHFDYITVHPYETLGLVEQGFEAELMAVVPTLRKMLARVNPDRANVPVWFTEIGEPVSGSVSAEHQAQTLLKAYTLGIAQGVRRIHWFEGVDGDSGPFGLIDAAGMKRPAYAAMTQLIHYLGATPRYVGWVLLNDKHYAFIFQGSATAKPVMVAWALPGASDDVTFSSPITLVNPISAVTQTASTIVLTNAPSIVVGVPSALVSEAAQNKTRPFPWGGDYSAAQAVSYSALSGPAGLHPLGTGTLVTVDGMPARDQSGSAGQSFTVDPNFLSYDTLPIQITVVLRRKGADPAGFNLKYEAKTGMQSTGGWFGVPAGDQWTTQTWTVDDDQFVGKWGYNFSFDSDSTANSKYLIQSVRVTKR